MRESLFYDLSTALTGEPQLDRCLAGEHLQRLVSHSSLEAVESLLQTYSEIEESPAQEHETLIRQRIFGDASLADLGRSVIMLWYVGDPVPDPRPPAGRSATAYFSGLVWRIASAHPPGVSGGYFGHWTYRPDN